MHLQKFFFVCLHVHVCCVCYTIDPKWTSYRIEILGFHGRECEDFMYSGMGPT
jgi:hypothetical protein